MIKSILNDGPAAMPVLFLDIDGVMNTSAFALANRSGLIFRTESVIALNRILTESGCRVVISSSWRREPRINLGAIFETQGVAKFRACLAGITPDLSKEERYNRGDEIEAWLSKARFTGRLAILDDDQIMGLFSLWHCRTDEHKGLTPAIANRVIEMLVYGPIVSVTRSASMRREGKRAWLVHGEFQRRRVIENGPSRACSSAARAAGSVAG